MRILLACPYDWGAPGGVQVHVRQLAGSLAARGHQVIVLAPGIDAPGEPSVRLVGRPMRVPYRGTVAPICPWPGSWRRVGAELREFRPQVVHVHEPFTPSTSMFAAWRARVPVVATFHAYLGRSRLLSMAAPALRPLWRKCSVRIAVSEAAAAFAAAPFGGGRMDIVPNGVDTAPFRETGEPAPDLPPGRRILWVNRLDPQKGFPVMVRAFGLIAADLPDVSLVVAGDGRDRGAIGSLPPEFAARVRMLGRVDHDLVPAYQRGADLFVSAAAGQESFGIVLVEAMAAGVPVVATDIPGYREVIRDGTDGVLVPPRNPLLLADAVRRVLVDGALSKRLREAGRSRAREFSWDIVTPRIEAAYDAAVASRGR